MGGRQARKIPVQHIALMGLDFGFSEMELRIFRNMWQSGESIYKIAEVMKRDPDEIVILVMDQARLGMIGNRPGGMFGRFGHD